MKHFTIPIFVPELACPNRCVFCNQHSISGCLKQPEPDEVRDIILQHLKTIPEKDSHIEVGFFGGSFTGIEPELQEKYLAVANEFLEEGYRWSIGAETIHSEVDGIRFSSETYDHSSSDSRWSSGAETTLKSNRIQGIRLSTRPDYIDAEVLNRLKRYGVTTIELGAQSLDDEVLRLSGRGHTVADVEKASAMICAAGFRLGLQMMTGLPGDKTEKSMQTAQKIIELGANCTRIYPTLVIRGTELEQRWRKGDYQPQTLDEAVELSARLLNIFQQSGVEVIRVGLHPSEGLLDGSEMLAGPFHPSFRELVETFIWNEKLKPLISEYPAGNSIRIPVPEVELRYAIGYDSANRIMLEKHFNKVEFVPESLLNQERPLVITDKRLPLPAKNALKTIGQLTLLQTNELVYKPISGHPDIFMCQAAEGTVFAPGLPETLLTEIKSTEPNFFPGEQNPGKAYPESARFNAVVTPEFIIHNLKMTDPAIFNAFPGRKQIHVNQGYTRCNLLVLDDSHFITSDRGIEKVLRKEGKIVLYVDPATIKLKGQKYGFFGGCCGICNNDVLIAGSLKYHPQGDTIRDFIDETDMIIKELYDGPLVDVGGIFVFLQVQTS